MKRLAVVLVCIALSACGGLTRSDSDNDETRGPYPTNWKKLVADYIRKNYVDPNSVIDSEAAPPFKTRNTLLDASWTVCIRNNAKNRFGGYTGLQVTELSITKGRVVSARPENQFSCPNAQFEPFPLN